MSHRALVGLPVTANRVDLHRSRNGAHNLKLYPIYEALLAADDPQAILALDEPGDDLTSEIRQLRASFDTLDPETPLVDPEPEVDNLPVEKVGDMMDYLQYEAFVLPSRYDPSQQATSQVSVFLPVLVDVAVILAFMNYLRLEIYPRTKLPDDPQLAISRINDGDISPEASLEGEEYLELEDRPDVLEHVIDGHRGLLQSLKGAARGHDREVLVSVLTEETYLVGRVAASNDVYLPESMGEGLLVRLPVEDFTHEQVVSLYDDWEYLADRLRVEYSLEAARNILMAESEPETDRRELETGLLTELRSEFDAEISDLSSSHYLDRIQES